MSQIREALEVIGRVNFREPIPHKDATTIAGFLERATHELQRREEDLAKREQEVSQREADATVKEGDVEEKLAALESLGRVQKVLDLKPMRNHTQGRLRFWRR